MSRVFLKILAAPYKQAFWSNEMPSSNPIFFTDALKLLLIVPSYPMITSMTVTFLQFQIFSISLLRSWYFSIFSCSFSGTRVSKGQATYITLHVLSSSSKTSMSRLLCSRRWCLWTLKSHSTFTWSFPLQLPERDHTTYPCIGGGTSCIASNGWLVRPCHVSTFCTVFALISYILLLHDQ